MLNFIFRISFNSQVGFAQRWILFLLVGILQGQYIYNNADKGAQQINIHAHLYVYTCIQIMSSASVI